MKKVDAMKQAIYNEHEAVVKTIYMFHGMIYQSHLTQLFDGIYSKQDISSIVQILKEHSMVRTYEVFSNQFIVLGNYCIQKLSKNSESNEYFTYNQRNRLKSAFISGIALNIIKDKILQKKVEELCNLEEQDQISYIIEMKIAEDTKDEDGKPTENFIRTSLKLAMLDEYKKSQDKSEVEKYKTEIKQIRALQSWFRKNKPELLNKMYTKIWNEVQLASEFENDKIAKTLKGYMFADKKKAIEERMDMLRNLQKETNLLKTKDIPFLKCKNQQFHDIAVPYVNSLTEADKEDYETINRVEQLNAIFRRFKDEKRLQEYKLKQTSTPAPEENREKVNEIKKEKEKVFRELKRADKKNLENISKLREVLESYDKELEVLSAEKMEIAKKINALGIGTESLADLRNRFIFVEDLRLEYDREKHDIYITVAVADVLHTLTYASFAKILIEAVEYFRLFFYLPNSMTGEVENYMRYHFRIKAYLPNRKKKDTMENKREHIDKAILDKLGKSIDTIEYEIVDLNLTDTVFCKQVYYRKNDTKRVRKFEKDSDILSTLDGRNKQID